MHAQSWLRRGGSLIAAVTFWGARRLCTTGILKHTRKPGLHIPKVFAMDDACKVRELITAHPLATLVVQTPDGLCVNHVPLLHQLDPGKATGAGVLQGHVARANPLWRHLGDGAPAVAVFHGPQHYISPNFYPSKQRDHKVVPTWNYVVVHVQGELKAIDDPEWVAGQIEALTEQQEATQPNPWRVQDAPSSYIEQMTRAIVGIELQIETVQAKRKVSQNQSAENQAGVVSGLEALAGTKNQAAEMAVCVAGDSTA